MNHFLVKFSNLSNFILFGCVARYIASHSKILRSSRGIVMYNDKLSVYLFKQKAISLLKNPYVNSLRNTKKITLSRNILESWPNYFNHRSSTIDSFILNFRFMILQDDGLSIYVIRDILGRNNKLSDATKKAFKEFGSFQRINIGTKMFKKDYKNEQLFRILFYGGMAHHNKDKVLKFINLRANLLTNLISYICLRNYVLKIIDIVKSLLIDCRQL